MILHQGFPQTSGQSRKALEADAVTHRVESNVRHGNISLGSMDPVIGVVIGVLGREYNDRVLWMHESHSGRQEQTVVKRQDEGGIPSSIEEDTSSSGQYGGEKLDDQPTDIVQPEIPPQASVDAQTAEIDPSAISSSQNTEEPATPNMASSSLDSSLAVQQDEDDEWEWVDASLVDEEEEDCDPSLLPDQPISSSLPRLFVSREIGHGDAEIEKRRKNKHKDEDENGGYGRSPYDNAGWDHGGHGDPYRDSGYHDTHHGGNDDYESSKSGSSGYRHGDDDDWRSDPHSSKEKDRGGSMKHPSNDQTGDYPTTSNLHSSTYKTDSEDDDSRSDRKGGGFGGHKSPQDSGPSSRADCSALKGFYRAMGGDEWTNRHGWDENQSDDCCEWFGVVCQISASRSEENSGDLNKRRKNDEDEYDSGYGRSKPNQWDGDKDDREQDWQNDGPRGGRVDESRFQSKWDDPSGGSSHDDGPAKHMNRVIALNLANNNLKGILVDDLFLLDALVRM